MPRRRSRSPRRRSSSSRSSSSSSNRSDSPRSPQSSRVLAVRPDPMPNVESLMIKDYLHTFREENAVRTDLIDCKVYISCLPAGTQQADFLLVLVSAMQGLRLTTKAGDPVVTVEMGHDGTYAFVDFRCVEEANNALTLHGMTFRGKEIKVSRPKNYTGSQPLSSQSLNCIFGSYATKNMTKRPLEDFGQQTLDPPKRVELASNVIVLVKAVTNLKELQSENEFKDLWEDMEQELRTHGNLVSLKIPRPGVSSLGVGNVYAQFATKDDARNARRILLSKRFAGKFLQIKYHPEVMFLQDDFREGWMLQAITYSPPREEPEEVQPSSVG